MATKEKIMINKDNIEILYPGIMVFRKGLPNPEDLIKKIEDKADWEAWYDVGKQIVINRNAAHAFDNFPTPEEWRESRIKLDERTDPANLKDVVDILEEAFYEATHYYFSQYPSTLDNWMHGGSNILKYEGKKEITTEAYGTKELTLPFHTDFHQPDEFKPGPKAEYTVTIYLNDDYVGGEIDYRIFNGKNNDLNIVDGELVPRDPDYGEVPALQYRPQPGDIIIFPSRPPYYHGVRKVTEGTKRFVRMFWMSQVF